MCLKIIHANKLGHFENKKYFDSIRWTTVAYYLAKEQENVHSLHPAPSSEQYTRDLLDDGVEKYLFLKEQILISWIVLAIDII